MNEKSVEIDKDYVPDFTFKGLYEESLMERKVSSSSGAALAALRELEARYTDFELIGEGAIKRVYKCYDERTKKEVAFAQPKEDLSRLYHDFFVYEAWLTSSLSHPNIIKVYDVYLDDENVPYFTMDLKRPRTLSDLVKGGADQATLLETFMKVCDAVAYAHSQGVIHLDIKPENVQCDNFREVLLCDWGLGQKLNGAEEQRAVVPEHLSLSRMETLHSEIRGSLGYMSPEQVNKDILKGVSSDIFSLGCLLYFILTGHHPYEGEGKTEIIKKTREASIQSPRARFGKKIPIRLDSIVMKAVQKEPRDRYSTVSALQEEILRYESGFPVEAETLGVARRFHLFIKRNAQIALLLLSGLFLLSLVSTTGIYFYQKQKASALLEKERVFILSEKLDDLEHDFHLYEDAVGKSKTKQDRVAYEIIRYAHDLLFSDSQEVKNSVDDAHTLLIKALEYVPENKVAQDLFYFAKFIRLDQRVFTREVDPIVIRPNIHKLKLIVEKFPLNDLSPSKRPPLKDLYFLIDECSKSEDQFLNSTIMKVLLYDMDTRAEEEALSLLLYLIRAYHPDQPPENIQYDEVNKHLSLGPETVNEPKWCLSRFCSFFRLAELNRLTCSFKKPFIFAELDRAKISELDLSSCQQIILTSNVSLPDLKVLILNQSQIETLDLSFIKTEGNFEVVQK